MRWRATFDGSGSWSGWTRRYGLALRLAACFLSVTIASAVIPGIERWEPENNLLWVANGLLLAYLLLAPRWRWPLYLGAGFLGLSFRILFFPDSWNVILLYNVLDMIEVGTAALLLRPRSAQLPRFTERFYFIRFIGYGVILGPLLAGSVFASILTFWPVDPQPHPFLSWVASDSLGIAICTPAFVAVFRARFKNTVDWRQEWYLPVLLIAVTYAAFAQSAAPLLYFIYPLLVLVLVRLGLGYASMFTLCTTAIAGWLTIHGHGPFANPDANHPARAALQLQFAIASAVLLIYSVSVILENWRAIERRLAKIAELHALISENSRDGIILADFKGRRSYVSAAVERLAGWPPEEFARYNSLALLHPDDVSKAEAIERELRAGAEGATMECRIRKYTGGYLWVEASLRGVRDLKTGAPTGVLNIVRDVTERKIAEQKLQDAYKAVEALAATDSLTGLANRRRFDQVLHHEWRRGMRDETPISVLMIDVDLFKSYNDEYGHPKGDSCLKQIAEAIRDAIGRPGDLVARFGGEEFAVILPNTDSDGALLVGNDICIALRRRRLLHGGNPMGIVTVSVGCATMVPAFRRHVVNLVEFADEALYEAKRQGRNTVCKSNGPDDNLADSKRRGPVPPINKKSA